jgi:hypothetical protein
MQLKVISPTITLDITGAYASGDVLFGLTAIPNRGGFSNGVANMLRTVTVIDRYNQAPEFDLVLFDCDAGDPTLAAANAAWTLTADHGEKIINFVDVDAADYGSIAATGGAVRIAHFSGLQIPINTDTLKIAGISRGTPNYASGSATTDFVIRLGIDQSI